MAVSRNRQEEALKQLEAELRNAAAGEPIIIADDVALEYGWLHAWGPFERESFINRLLAQPQNVIERVAAVIPGAWFEGGYNDEIAYKTLARVQNHAAAAAIHVAWPAAGTVEQQLLDAAPSLEHPRANRDPQELLSVIDEFEAIHSPHSFTIWMRKQPVQTQSAIIARLADLPKPVMDTLLVRLEKKYLIEAIRNAGNQHDALHEALRFAVRKSPDFARELKAHVPQHDEWIGTIRCAKELDDLLRASLEPAAKDAATSAFTKNIEAMDATVAGNGLAHALVESPHRIARLAAAPAEVQHAVLDEMYHGFGRLAATKPGAQHALLQAAVRQPAFLKAFADSGVGVAYWLVSTMGETMVYEQLLQQPNSAELMSCLADALMKWADFTWGMKASSSPKRNLFYQLAAASGAHNLAALCGPLLADVDVPSVRKEFAKLMLRDSLSEAPNGKPPTLLEAMLSDISATTPAEQLLGAQKIIRHMDFRLLFDALQEPSRQNPDARLIDTLSPDAVRLVVNSISDDVDRYYVIAELGQNPSLAIELHDAIEAELGRDSCLALALEANNPPLVAHIVKGLLPEGQGAVADNLWRDNALLVLVLHKIIKPATVTALLSGFDAGIVHRVLTHPSQTGPSLLAATVATPDVFEALLNLLPTPGQKAFALSAAKGADGVPLLDLLNGPDAPAETKKLVGAIMADTKLPSRAGEQMAVVGGPGSRYL